ncbi:PKD domain-containing protein [Lutibacter sp. TH_r2]|uniref:PKD domain-containing protein n=1 Tax=Lutibacter sp. TH_r2 TaxID=3082083 RepID=UPI002954F56C|nr:PKD domain-containing protein [Lutibacter sp. TH_r2]MDV7186444.1 PKD domain-containing protein [Lutibacter sp. TH_r2]
MKSIKNIKKGILNLLPKIVLSFMVVSLASCDPTIDGLSYDLAEANSKEDQKAPTAFFGAVTGEGDQWNKATFANESVSASSYIWDFGDGSDTSTDFEPKEHSYPPVSASYQVTLQVFDSNGLTDTYTNSITIIDNGTPLGDLDLFYDLINTGDAGEPVTIHSYSSYQVEKDAFPENTLDKNAGTLWTAEDGDILAGDYKSDGEYVIYDLSETVNLRVIQFTTNVKSESYGYQIWTSNTGTDDADFTKLIPETGDIMLSEAASAEFQTKILSTPVDTRYVKLVGFGRFNEAGDTRTSPWMSFSQIEFYKDKN